MKESDIDKIADEIFALVIKHNKIKENRQLKIQEKYKILDGKLYFFQIVWDDDRKSTHLIGAQIKKDNLDEAEFLSPNNHITVKTKDLPIKFEQALAEIPKKNQQTY